MYRYRHQLLEVQNWLRGEPRFIARKGQSCVYCDSMENLTVDHKLAQALGGTDECVNLQVLCRPCNRQKATEEVLPLAQLKTVADRAKLPAPAGRANGSEYGALPT